jgi:hypothetical protein
MNVEIGAEAALFPEKEYINGIAVAVRLCVMSHFIGNGDIVRGVLGNKCAGQHNLKTVHFREIFASGNFLAWFSGVCVFFTALYLP